MDPLTALGLAANVVQFVDFGLKLFGTSAEIAKSAKGGTAHNLELESVYTKLQTFGLKLMSSIPGPRLEGDIVAPGRLLEAHSSVIRPHIDAIQQIAADCVVVCRQLLDVMQSLRVDATASHRHIKSLGAALKTALRTKTIAGLDERLKRFQAVLALHFLPLLNERQAYMSRILNNIETQNRHLAREQTTRFDNLSSQLEVLLSKIQALSSEPDKNEARVNPKDVESLGEILDVLSLAEKDLTVAVKEQGLLKSLNFSTRTYRHEDIPEAHKSTFEWIFSDQKHFAAPDTTPAAIPAAIPDAALDDALDSAANTTETPSGFMTWLESGRGTFWVSGKAGAGKSTLMKFIADHTKTRRALETWSGTKKVIIASHYFWSAGTAMQKSLKGLLQGLVFDILCRCPELAPDIFRKRCWGWNAKSWAAGSSAPDYDDAWTVSELRKGLLQVAKHPAMPFKCCFFIDGLDEYGEDHIELCKMLEDFASSDNLKCCVSSRPWNVFEDAFGGNKATYLRVHELTYSDIGVFTRSRLKNITKWKEMRIDDAQAEKLARFITEHAQGVFLWVYLVTKSLREGVIDGDTFDDLQKRLEVVPTELEPYFKHMLDRVNTVHHGYMAQTLQMALNAKKPLHLMAYYASEYERKDANYALTRPPECDVRRAHFYPEFYQPCRRRINARCGGVLGFRKQGVEFIHRTVHDFLQTGPMHDYLASKVKPGFRPNLSTLKALVFLFRCMLPTAATATVEASVEYMEDSWRQCLAYANGAMEEDEEATTLLLDGITSVQQEATFDKAFFLQAAFDRLFRRSVVFTKNASYGTPRGSRSKTLAVQSTTASGDTAGPGLRYTYLRAGVDKYVLAKLRSNPRYYDGHNVSLLATVLSTDERWTQVHSNIILALLENGSDPNEEVQLVRSIDTPWVMLFRRGRTNISSPAYRIIMTTIGYSLMIAFLKHGASRTVPTSVSGDRALRYFATFSVLTQHDQHTPDPIKLKLQAVLEAIDIFLNASREDNKVQLEDALCRIKQSRLYPQDPDARSDTKPATTKVLERLLLRAVQLRLPARSFRPVLANKDFQSTISPDVLTAFKNYMKLVAAPVHASPLLLADSDSKRPRLDSESEEARHDAKRPKNGREPSNPIVID